MFNEIIIGFSFLLLNRRLSPNIFFFQYNYKFYKKWILIFFFNNNKMFAKTKGPMKAQNGAS